MYITNQDELAQAIGYSPGHLSKYKHGAALTSEEFLRALSAVVGTDPATLATASPFKRRKILADFIKEQRMARLSEVAK